VSTPHVNGWVTKTKTKKNTRRYIWEKNSDWDGKKHLPLMAL